MLRIPPRVVITSRGAGNHPIEGWRKAPISFQNPGSSAGRTCVFISRVVLNRQTFASTLAPVELLPDLSGKRGFAQDTCPAALALHPQSLPVPCGLPPKEQNREIVDDLGLDEKRPSRSGRFDPLSAERFALQDAYALQVGVQSCSRPQRRTSIPIVGP